MLQLQQSENVQKRKDKQKYLMAVWTLSGPWYLEDMKNYVHQEKESIITRCHSGILVFHNKEIWGTQRE